MDERSLTQDLAGIEKVVNAFKGKDGARQQLVAMKGLWQQATTLVLTIRQVAAANVNMPNDNYAVWRECNALWQLTENTLAFFDQCGRDFDELLSQMKDEPKPIAPLLGEQLH